MEIQNHHLNPAGLLHGGVSATMLDTVMGIAVMAANPGVHALTLSFHVNYLAPIEEGKVFAEGEIVHHGSKTVTVQGRVTDGKGKLYVFGTGTFRITSIS